MTRDHSDFPTRARLWHGVVLTTIAHAVASAPGTTWFEVDWDGNVYVLNDGSGTRGAVAFDRSGLVGVFCDGKSSRVPWLTDEPYDPNEYFAGMPDNLREMAQLVCQYQLYEIFKPDVPAITSAFWSSGDNLTAIEPWKDVIGHGAHILRIQMLDVDEAVPALEEDLELSPAQLTLVYALYMRRMSSLDPVIVKSWEYRLLTATGDAGIEWSREILAAINVVLP